MVLLQDSIPTISNAQQNWSKCSEPEPGPGRCSLTKQERLNPEFQQFALEFTIVLRRSDIGRCLQFDPIDGRVFVGGSAVPYCDVLTEFVDQVPSVSIQASTSPAITSLLLPIPVLTKEQYCALLFTTSSSRRSMSSRLVECHGV